MGPVAVTDRGSQTAALSSKLNFRLCHKLSELCTAAGHVLELRSDCGSPVAFPIVQIMRLESRQKVFPAALLPPPPHSLSLLKGRPKLAGTRWQVNVLSRRGVHVLECLTAGSLTETETEYCTTEECGRGVCVCVWRGVGDEPSTFDWQLPAAATRRDFL